MKVTYKILHCAIILIVLSGCGGSGSGSGSGSGNTSTSEILGTYTGSATILLRDSWGNIPLPSFSVSCYFKYPLKVNDTEKETNTFNLFCSTNGNSSLTLGGFNIISAVLMPVTGYKDKLLVQHWNFIPNNNGFTGSLVQNNSNSIGSITSNFFTARETLPGMQIFLPGQYGFCDDRSSSCQQAILLATYYPSSSSINIKINGQGLSKTLSGTNSGLAEIVIDMTLTKSY